MNRKFADDISNPVEAKELQVFNLENPVKLKVSFFHPTQVENSVVGRVTWRF